jgi:hypothetical protein
VGHEAIIYGNIVGAGWRAGEQFALLYELNRQAILQVPTDDNWPWIVRGIFALPAAWPQGTYRSQLIHFGLSMKDDPGNRQIWDIWLGKFEAILRRMYWTSATAHIETDFDDLGTIRWAPTKESLGLLYDDPPQPIAAWTRVTSRP